LSADFRGPTFHRELFPRRQSFGDRPARGFAELLLDDAELPDAPTLQSFLIETRVENLLWLPATVTNASTGTLAARAGERLTSGRARRLLATLSGLCDLIVIDTPPALLAESASLNALVDGVLLVVRPGNTRRTALERTMRSWKSSPITPLGVVLNGTRPEREDTLSSTSPSPWRSRRRGPQEGPWPGPAGLRSTAPGADATKPTNGRSGSTPSATEST
jgi:Mrp family chromosome partitioning ATPase